ncbi:GPI-anchored surface protein, putative, partial [Bodo saltans]
VWRTAFSRKCVGTLGRPLTFATRRRARRPVTLLLLRSLNISCQSPFDFILFLHTKSLNDLSIISTFRSLQHLDISGLILQQCVAQLPSLASLASLQRLFDMSHCCDLLASDLCTILALSHLTHLNLWYCSGVTDTVLSSIALLSTSYGISTFEDVAVFLTKASLIS